MRGVQDLHPLVCKGVDFHGDGDMDGSDKLFSLVPASIKTLWLACSRTSRRVAPHHRHFHKDGLPYADAALAAASETSVWCPWRSPQVHWWPIGRWASC